MDFFLELQWGRRIQHILHLDFILVRPWVEDMTQTSALYTVSLWAFVMQKYKKNPQLSYLFFLYSLSTLPSFSHISSLLSLEYGDQVPKLLNHLFLLPEKIFPQERYMAYFLTVFRCLLKWHCIRVLFQPLTIKYEPQPMLIYFLSLLNFSPWNLSYSDVSFICLFVEFKFHESKDLGFILCCNNPCAWNSAYNIVGP